MLQIVNPMLIDPVTSDIYIWHNGQTSDLLTVAVRRAKVIISLIFTDKSNAKARCVCVCWGGGVGWGQSGVGAGRYLDGGYHRIIAPAYIRDRLRQYFYLHHLHYFLDVRKNTLCHNKRVGTDWGQT